MYKTGNQEDGRNSLNTSPPLEECKDEVEIISSDEEDIQYEEGSGKAEETLETPPSIESANGGQK